MNPELFSQRYGLRPTPEGLMYEKVPEQARLGFYYIVEQSFKDKDEEALVDLYKHLCVELRVPYDRNIDIAFSRLMFEPYNEGAIRTKITQAIERLINNCEWWQFYDICELTWESLIGKRVKDNFSTQVNILFRDEQLGFELTNGKIEKVGSGFIDARIKEVRYLLKEQEFKGADKHFEKAIKALNIRPNPDVENCVKDAVSAIESVGRIIVNDDKALLSDIIKDMANKGIIPKPLDQAIQKIYAYRGDQPGVAHGLVGTSKVTVDEAEFVLAMSAAIIIYLVKKRNKCQNHLKS